METGKSGPFLQSLTAGSETSDVTVHGTGVALGGQEFVWVVTAELRRELVTIMVRSAP